MKTLLMRFGSAVLAVCVFGCGTQPSPTAVPAEPSDSQAKPSGNDTRGATAQSKPEPAETVALRILDYDGIQELIASHKGKVVVMDVWATTCAPCIKEFPGLVALDREHGEDVACISVSSDFYGIGEPEDHRDEVLAFLKEQNATFDNVLSSTKDEELYTEKLDIPSIPAVFVYDRDGKLAKQFGGGQGDFTYEKDVIPFVEELLAGR